MKTKILVLLMLISITSIAYSQQWQQYKTKSKNNNCMFEDSQGKLWFHSSYNFAVGKLTVFDGTSATSYSKLGGQNVRFVPAIAEHNGKIYLATQTGLLENSNGNWKLYNKKNGLPSPFVINLHESKENLWVFTSKFMTGEFGFLKDGKFEKVSMDGHSGKSVVSVLQDSEGNIWTGMHLGKLAMFNGEKWTDFSSQMKGKHIKAIAIDSKGAIWISGIEGYFAKYEKGKWTEFKHGSGYFNAVTAAPMFIIGVLPGILIGYIAPDLTSYGDVEVDKNDNAWILARKRGVLICDGQKYDKVENKTGSPKTKKVSDLLVDSKGNIWLSDYSGKVFKYNFSSWQVYTKKDGLPKGIQGIFEDSKGSIWVSGKKAIAVLKQ